MAGCRCSAGRGAPDVRLPDLVLRDIHEPPPPLWWPPAPGWWWLAAALLVLLLGAVAYLWYRRRRVRAWQRLFDQAVAAAGTGPARIAAMSALLRRAARGVRPDADRLQGDAWLAFLDGDAPGAGFVKGPGAALRDGGFRRDADDVDLEALQALARRRFLALMAAAR